ncbi:RagB/SusD family nutrient uptake outer membrane protein [uncultured Prevotella sp.]|uniref:RagB/SusD family nutrient uptake outer membrane protein n=1 Tax=uncultured Prevotella sp. TaxID=159272 RepID=UPI0025F8F2BE|nr:RagB/SusD family nutrient uptake outer membrane protein [uncultured Prevotella sp.]MBD9247000.1 RagB/SusD family nutrient uptake outer membrane protein [Prevotella sp.]
MKNIIKMTLAAAVLGITASCTDLDVDVKSKYTEYPNDPVAIEGKMSDVYYSFRQALGNNYNRVQTFSSDEATGVSFGTDYFDKGENIHPSIHNFMSGDDPANYWTDLASGITKCNKIIEEFKETPKVAAPARLMRAFYHFILMDSYGDVPVLDHLPADNEAVVRSPRKEVAEFIEKEVKECLPDLSDKNDASTYGKPNKWMAEALLVKLYINWGVYTCGDVTKYDVATTKNSKLDECVKYCDDIIGSGLFNLNDPYRKKFMFDNGPQIKDFIYAMPYDKVSAQGLLYGRYRAFRRIDDGDTQGYYGGKMGKSCAGICAMNPEFADLFCLEGDDRNDAVLKGKVFIHDAITGEETDKPYIYKGTQLELTKTITLQEGGLATLNCGATPDGWRQGYRSIKFYPNPNEYSAYNRYQSNDVPIFRFADIILTKAEAIKRGATATNGDTPQSLFNQIRSYVHAPLLDHDPSLQEILDERGREFFDENWRRNDMIRFGTFESEYGFHKHSNPDARFDKTCRILPVPDDILKENTNWEQNPGYNN